MYLTHKFTKYLVQQMIVIIAVVIIGSVRIISRIKARIGQWISIAAVKILGFRFGGSHDHGKYGKQNDELKKFNLPFKKN